MVFTLSDTCANSTAKSQRTTNTVFTNIPLNRNNSIRYGTCIIIGRAEIFNRVRPKSQTYRCISSPAEGLCHPALIANLSSERTLSRYPPAPPPAITCPFIPPLIFATSPNGGLRCDFSIALVILSLAPPLSPSLKANDASCCVVLGTNVPQGDTALFSTKNLPWLFYLLKILLLQRSGIRLYRCLKFLRQRHQF